MHHETTKNHIFSFHVGLLILSTSSCKKESVSFNSEDTSLSTADAIKSVSVSRDRIALITTTSGNHYTQDVSVKGSQKILTSVASNEDSSLVFTLIPPVSGPKKGTLGTNVVDPNGGFQPIVATVTYSGGITTVRLSTYSQFSNGITQTATVYGISGDSYGGSFWVQYVQTSGGVVVHSEAIEYFYHF